MASKKQDEYNSFGLVDEKKRRRLNEKDSDYSLVENEVETLTSENIIEHDHRLSNQNLDVENLNDIYSKVKGSVQKQIVVEDHSDRELLSEDRNNTGKSMHESEDSINDISSNQDFESNKKINESYIERSTTKDSRNTHVSKDTTEHYLEKSSSLALTKQFDESPDNCNITNLDTVHFKMNSSSLNSNDVDNFVPNLHSPIKSKVDNSNEKKIYNPNVRKKCEDTHNTNTVSDKLEPVFYPQYGESENLISNIGFSDTINETVKGAYASQLENTDSVQNNTDLPLSSINGCENKNDPKNSFCISNNNNGIEKKDVEENSNYTSGEVHQENCYTQSISKTNDIIPPLWTPHDDYKYINKHEQSNFRHNGRKSTVEPNSLPVFKSNQLTEQQQSIDLNSHDINRYINEQENFPQQDHSQIQSSNHFLHDPNIFNQMVQNSTEHLQQSSQSQMINEAQQIQHQRDIFLESHHQYSQGQYFKNHQQPLSSQSITDMNSFNDMQQQLQLHRSLQHHQEEKHQLHMNAPQLPNYLHASAEHSRISQQHNQQQQQESLQTRNAYQHLMMDEFHEDPNTTYKLTLSPTVKHENQDDGYETSAGDVLTPNSHSSSTHSITPQQQVQQNSAVVAKMKQDDHHQIQTHQEQILNQVHVDTIIENTPRDNASNAFGVQEEKTFLNNQILGNAENLKFLESVQQHNRHDEIFFNQRHPQNLNPENSSPHDRNQLHSNENLEGESHYQQPTISNNMSLPIQKRRGRKKKVLDISMIANNPNENIGMKNKERKKHDRFNGMSEEEVMKRTLPDHLCDNLDIVIIGINPGLFAAYKGHHYAGPGNHFWKCLYLAGLTTEQMSSDEDYKLINSGIGFTNMVQRPTKGSADLTRKEIKEGSRILLEKLQKFRPKIAVFNGKLIFEVFSGKKDFNFGRQPEYVEGTNTYIWVMPSSSARCAQLPRAADKVPFYFALKKFRDFINGIISHMDESEFVFTEERIKEICPQEKSLNLFGTNSVLMQSEGSSPNAVNDIKQVIDQSFVNTNLPQKKKRGRPKKNKDEHVIDPTTGNAIPTTHQTARTEDFNGILNLSLIGETIEVGKKKRGRPKKVKPMFEVTQSQQNLGVQHKVESLSVQSPQTAYHHHGSYEMQSSNGQQRLYNNKSPSSLNCNFRATTPIMSDQQTQQNPKCQPSDDINTKKVNSSSKLHEDDNVSHHHHTQHANSQMPNAIEPQLGESPPPSSPNICADFDPPTSSSTRVEENDLKQREMDLQSQRMNLPQSSRYSSPAHDHVPEQHSSENFQQWMSPQNQQLQSTASQYSAQHSEQVGQLSSHLHYQAENQLDNVQLQQNNQWQRNQSFDDTTSNYIISSRHLNIPQGPDGQHPKVNTQLNSDVARKSISGLESLVEQIPNVSENDSVCSTGSSAAAIAVENRLQDLHCQSSNASTPNETFICNNRNTPSSITDAPRRTANSTIHNSSFSVSNLAESAASPNNNNNTGFGSNSALNNSGNPYRTNIITAAALAAVASNSSSSSPHHVPHTQLYIDPHSHIPHVSSNSMYVPPTHHHSSSHHQHHTLAHHHHAAHHHPAYGAPTGAVATSTDYSNPYGLPGQTSSFHMPSPNYPYGYASPTAQTNYASYMHSHHAHHGHHAHPAHHLSIFERLKPSDIGSYGGF